MGEKKLGYTLRGNTKTLINREKKNQTKFETVSK